MTFISTDLDISKTEASIHKNALQISEEAKRISKTLGIIEETLYEGHSSMTNYIYSDCPSDSMVTVHVIYNVLYYLDDLFGEDTHVGIIPNMAHILDIWSGKTVFTSRHKTVQTLYDAIAYSGATLRKSCPNAFFLKYTKSLVAHVSASLTTRPYTTVQEYIEIRKHTGGMYMLIDLIEYVHGCYLTPDLLNDNTLYLNKLCDQCALIGSLSNDIFSYAKEKHSAYNLINAYLNTSEATTYNEAVTLAITKVNGITHEFKNTLEKALQATKVLSQEAQDTLTIYYGALEVIIAASYHWQKATDRYYHPENIFEDMKVYPLKTTRQKILIYS